MMEATLKGLLDKPKAPTRILLTIPIRGWSRKTQPIAVKNVGSKAPSAMTVNTTPLAGKSVLSTSHAIGMAKKSATVTVVEAKPNVLRSVL
jgi:hypothetical protein